FHYSLCTPSASRGLFRCPGPAARYARGPRARRAKDRTRRRGMLGGPGPAGRRTAPASAVRCPPARKDDRMPPPPFEVLTALRLPELCRLVCARAGIPVRYVPTTPDRFIVWSHGEDPELLAKLLEDAFAEDEAEFRLFRRGEALPFHELRPGEVVVQ